MTDSAVAHTLPSAVAFVQGLSAGRATLLVAALALAAYLVKWALHKPIYPGPFQWPFLGALPYLLAHYHERYDFLAECMFQVPERIWAGWFPGMGNMVYVGTAEMVEHVLKTRFDNYVKGKPFEGRFAELLGEGIFNTDGENWKVQRKTASHMFAQRSLRETMFPVFLRHAREVVGQLGDADAHGVEGVDIQRLFFSLTLDSICEIAFGVNVDSMHHPAHPFAKAFDSAQYISEKRFFSLMYPIAPWLLPREWQLRKDIKVLNAFAYQVIRTRRESQAKEGAKEGEEEDLLSRFLRLRDSDGAPHSDKWIRDIIMNFIIAGRDTTAQALTWTTYLLSQHPEAEAKTVAEIESVVGERDPTFEDLSKLPYMEAVLSEVLRLFPSVPVDTKTPVEDDVLPGGWPVKAGEWIVYSAYMMGRDPLLWGEDAREFRPERWLDQPQPSLFRWPAFNAGPRTCLGMRMAKVEAKTMLCMLYRRFRPRLAQGKQVEYAISVTLPVKGGLWVKPRKVAAAQ